MTPAPTLHELIETVRRDTASDAALEQLRTAATTVAALEDVGDALLSHYVDRCRRGGHSWSEISAALGVSKQAAHKRFSLTAPSLERFTPRARNLLDHAAAIARGFGHDFIGTEHLLVALFEEPESVAARVLEQLGVTRDASVSEVLARVERGTASPSDPVPFTPLGAAAVAAAVGQALELGHNYVGTEHVLLALYVDGTGVAAQVLDALGAPRDRTRALVVEALSAFRRREA